MKSKNEFIDKINEFKKMNPNIGYNNLSKIFGISLYDLFKIYNIYDYQISKVNDNTRLFFPNIRIEINSNVLYEENLKGEWKIYHFDDNGKVIFVELSENHRIIFQNGQDGYFGR